MSDQKRMVLVATKGSLDWAYPPFILSTTAAALGFETSIFFTLYGLELLKRDLDLKLTPLGNPAMPVPPDLEWSPATLSDMQSSITAMMRERMKTTGLATIEELRENAIESGVRMIACQMTIDLFGIRRADLIDGLEFGGSATLVELGGQSTVSWFV